MKRSRAGQIDKRKDGGICMRCQIVVTAGKARVQALTTVALGARP